MNKILTENAPRPGGHYSQATVHNGVIYVSGQLPIAPGEGPKDPGSIGDQTRQALENLLAVVDASGGSVNSVLKVTLYVAHMDDWKAVNEVFAEVFGEHRPARTIVPVGLLHYGYAIEIDAIAAVE